jgi:diguanylate cyclase
VGSRLEVLIDETRILTIGEVSSADYESRFTPAGEAVPNFGITEAAVWARFAVFNPTDAMQHRLLSFNFPLAGHIRFYYPERGGGFGRMEAGIAVPRSESLIPHRYYVFPLRVEPRERITCYLRVVSDASMVLPLTLWEPGALDRKDRRDQMLFGIIYGVLLAFIFYFAALSLKLKNLSAMWFTYYIAALALLLACYQGYMGELISPAPAAFKQLVLLTAIGLVYFTGARFLRTFLDLAGHSRRIDRAIQLLQWMGLGFIPMNLFPNPLTPLYSVLLVGIGPLFSTGVSIAFWIKGVPNAKYFAFGWLVGHIMSEIDLLRVFGVIPWIPELIYILPAAMISSILFFSIAIMEQTRKYREFAEIDGLTGIGNRRSFERTLQLEWNRGMRSRRPLSIIMADIDAFKAFNDTYGHGRGDFCLKLVAQRFQAALKRAGDMAARYGGEELAAILPETGKAEAAGLAEKIRRSVEAAGIRHETSAAGEVVTISLGTGTMTPQAGKTPRNLVDLADMALYRAKQEGRNRVVSGGAD